MGDTAGGGLESTQHFPNSPAAECRNAGSVAPGQALRCPYPCRSEEDVAMRMIDFAPLSRSTIGFDRLFDLLNQTTDFEPEDSFPTYDIEKVGEDAYRIT